MRHTGGRWEVTLRAGFCPFAAHIPPGAAFDRPDRPQGVMLFPGWGDDRPGGPPAGRAGRIGGLIALLYALGGW